MPRKRKRTAAKLAEREDRKAEGDTGAKGGEAVSSGASKEMVGTAVTETRAEATTMGGGDVDEDVRPMKKAKTKSELEKERRALEARAEREKAKREGGDDDDWVASFARAANSRSKRSERKERLREKWNEKKRQRSEAELAYLAELREQRAERKARRREAKAKIKYVDSKASTLSLIDSVLGKTTSDLKARKREAAERERWKAADEKRRKEARERKKLLKDSINTVLVSEAKSRKRAKKGGRR
ncbi:uncharacterized protein AMSG_00894 [Thecamonas trahens ATCC 50062]|uniref:Uncharacterized protein n=1 Tax=Thecamonas trahens ATCC 50062 TaxID=461836 RepID=A0A0L0DIG1_THETB|nr:hypothetical protein AMSG_00894 [Thecamonas trahens ATCC 50062]KNC52067.1 hypothetical protein AMSG_00894 [Thecamonas trahens ATCC 50062]|eukprot:XP_013762072.1 hypothetical protein AMSG_00894 [Thecamonas trahens ATCC 50062]